VQASFSDLEFDAKKCLNCWDYFRAEIEMVTRWAIRAAWILSVVSERAGPPAHGSVLRRCCFNR